MRYANVLDIVGDRPSSKGFIKARGAAYSSNGFAEIAFSKQASTRFAELK